MLEHHMTTIAALRQARAKAADEIAMLVDDKKAFNAKEAEINGLDEQIERAVRAQKIAAGQALPGNKGPNAGDEGGFKSLGDQLISVARHFQGGGTDPRLVKAATGLGESDPSAGGFPIQFDFAQSVLTRAYDLGDIASRVFRLGISANSNGIKIPGIDETSRATGSRWGGVQAYWLGEGDAGTPSKPKFRLVELDLKKLMALWYVTDELMQDASALTGIANQAFAEELTFMIEDSIYRGTGAGQPLGFLNAPCKVMVPKETGQAAKTIVFENIKNMWSRMWNRSRNNAVWLINQDVEPQLYALNQIIGTGGVPVYLPPGGISEKPYATLFGRPVLAVEYADTLGAEGDIVLADFSQYVIADKNAVQQASSVHVRFTSDEMVFRLTYRVDGEPLWHAPLTPYKGTSTRSPFVTLAAR